MAISKPGFNSPVFQNRGAAVSAEQLDELYGRPSATPVDTGRMTYEDTIVKTLFTFGVLLVGAVIGWFVPILALPGALIGLVLGLVNSFKKEPSKGLVLAYAGFEGLFVGGISAIYQMIFGDGLVPMAVFGTLGVVGVTLALFASGKIRASARATKMFLVVMLGYAAFSLVNFGLMIFGVTSEIGPFGLRSAELFGIPIGFLLGIVVVLLAAYSLVLDFDNVQQGVRNGAPAKFAWRAAFGIVTTVVWLYVEILRMLAILQSND